MLQNVRLEFRLYTVLHSIPISQASSYYSNSVFTCHLTNNCLQSCGPPISYLGGIHIFHHLTCNVSLDVEDSMLKDRFEREI